MKESLHIWNEGTTQELRSIKALQPEYFRVDERNFDVLVKSVVDHAATIPYFNNRKRRDGTWADLINADEIVVLAQLRLLNVRHIENEFYDNFHQLRPTATGADNSKWLELALKTAIELHEQLKQWYKLLQSIPKSQSHHSIVEEWHMALGEIQENKQNLDFETVQQAEQFESLDRFFKTLIKTTFFLNSQYDKFFALAKSHQTHKPHNALIYAFLELLQHAQKAINSFHQRHLDYYYKQQLKLSNRKATADSTFLYFKLNEGANRLTIPKHTRMIAGQDENGKDLCYETEDDVIVDSSSIAAIKGLYVNRERRKNNDLQHVTHIITADHFPGSINSPWPVLNVSDLKRTEYIKNAEIGFSISSPNFNLEEGRRKITLTFHGDIRYYVPGPLIKQIFQEPENAKLSEVIKLLKKRGRSTLLNSFFSEVFVKSDKRQDFFLNEDFVIKLLSINSGEYSDRNLEQYIKSFGDISISQFVKKLSKTAKIPFDRSIKEEIESRDTNKKFHQVFKTALKVSCSSLSSWFEVQPISIDFTQGKDKSYELEIILVLDESLPPLVKNDQSFSPFPTLQFTINPRSSLYAYDLFELLCIDKVTCHINVEGIKTISLYNQLSQLDPNGPFIPFGPQPNTSSYLMIGNKEIFQKNFSKLKLNIEWMDLPAVSGGFKQHYKDYGFNLNNQTFQSSISILHQGSWYPKETDRQVDPLYDGKHKLEMSKQIKIDANLLNPKPDYSWNPETLQYTNSTKRGFIKLQLVHPEWGFGHLTYPGLVSQLAMQNVQKLNGFLSSFIKKKYELNLPPPPYTPKIDKLTMDYELEFDFSLGTKKNKTHQFYHIYPFDGYIANPASSIGFSLIPSFRQEGSLFIGIKSFDAPGSISILFHMNERKALKDLTEESRVYWDYLVNNKWVRFHPYEITKDSTSNLLKSGIVQLQVPTIKNKNNTILDNSLFWVRASALSGTEILGDVNDIELHAVEAHYKPQDEDQPDNYSIPAGKIDSAVNELPDLAGIFQPVQSFGGLPAESESSFKARISERLRHKNRCVNQYDYERIILQHFPDVNKVLCINAFNHLTNKQESGKVLLVVVPKTKVEEPNNTQPGVSISTLREIKSLLKSKLSPFIDLTIINPEYEHMRVFANVKLKDKFDFGKSMNLLNNELKAFIAPWITDVNAEPMFQRNITLEELQSFIQSRPYVEFVTKVSATKVHKEYPNSLTKDMYHLDDTGLDLTKDNMTKSTYLWSIITTANVHHLTSVDHEEFEFPDHAGLEELYLNEDFIIRNEREI